MKQQRHTFDEVAALYANARPGVPEAAVAGLFQALGLQRGAHVVEVGCGTGQLTSHLVARGLVVLALDPGAELLRECEARVPDPTYVASTFEAWRPTTRYAAVLACQAAHWIVPDAFIERSFEALTADGSIGLLWHVDVSQDTEFWRATEPLYARYLPDADDKPPRTIPLHIEHYRQALAADARFRLSASARWPWVRSFDEAAYLRLLETQSPVRLLGAEERRAFLDGHLEVIRRQGGRVERKYDTVLVHAVRC